MWETKVLVMVSFGSQGGLRSFALSEVDGSIKLNELVALFGPEGWSLNNNVSVKISSSKTGGFDKFSLNNSVNLVLKILKTDVLWIVFEKVVAKPLVMKNAFDVLKQAQGIKMLPKKIDKPINQKQELFNKMFDKFQKEGVSFSTSECTPRQKHKVTGQATQLLLDITEIVWKVGQSEKQLSGRGFWSRIPTELLKLISFEMKSKEPLRLSQHATKLFAEQIRDVADRTVMAQNKLKTMRMALLQTAEVFLDYSSCLKSNLESVKLVKANHKGIATAAEAIVGQIADREKVTVIEKGNKPLTNPVDMKLFYKMKDSEPYAPVNISVLLDGCLIQLMLCLKWPTQRVVFKSYLQYLSH